LFSVGLCLIIYIFDYIISDNNFKMVENSGARGRKKLKHHSRLYFPKFLTHSLTNPCTSFPTRFSSTDLPMLWPTFLHKFQLVMEVLMLGEEGEGGVEEVEMFTRPGLVL
jgi:hypothetical protein